MREPSPIDASFPTAHCAACDKIVLTYVALHRGEERRCCVHCDTVIGSELLWMSAEELESEGYYFGAIPPKSGGGCTSGCGSCSTRKN
jgi:hypothetical protein